MSSYPVWVAVPEDAAYVAPKDGVLALGTPRPPSRFRCCVCWCPSGEERPVSSSLLSSLLLFFFPTLSNGYFGYNSNLTLKNRMIKRGPEIGDAFRKLVPHYEPFPFPSSSKPDPFVRTESICPLLRLFVGFTGYFVAVSSGSFVAGGQVKFNILINNVGGLETIDEAVHGDLHEIEVEIPVQHESRKRRTSVCPPTQEEEEDDDEL
ncbi:hypothetical protein LXL04_017082 [Taraxacum kok-saghyz]